MRSIVSLLVLASILICFSGCTAIGAFIGRAADTSQPDSISLQPSQVRGISPSSTVVVLLRSGSQVQGEFLSVNQRSSDEYKKVYVIAAERLRQDIILPVIGERILLTTMSGRELDIDFKAFDLDGIWCVPVQEMEVTLIRMKVLKKIRLNSVVDIEAESLQRLMDAEKIPFSSTISIRDRDSVIVIPLDAMAMVKSAISKNSGLYGMLVPAPKSNLVFCLNGNMLRRGRERHPEQAKRVEGELAALLSMTSGK